MNNIKQLKDQERSNHPGFDSYINCMTRSLFTGLASFCLSFSCCYFAQKVLEAKSRFPGRYNILVSTVIASCTAYQVTSQRTKACQAGWMAAEGKHTALKDY
ncbi:uncharacterized protein LOC119682836 [Teleopsis dalmanni]|uniref:uncharacterized protein LOC119682836 n=1 Tax=Teleopsis dalmanni TaxID=139649 RepID=UPI0018CCB1DE|nr:uncharacterized protein LOC119682836 [Teleopsis dalmanni]